MLGLSLRNIAVVAGLVWSVLAFQGCTAPTGGENNPLLVVEPAILDFGSDRNSVNLVIRNGGSGILHWTIQAPAEGWIILSQREGIITQTATVEVRIDREKAPLGAQEVKLTIVADPGGTQEVVLKANISRPGKLSLSESQLDFGESEGAHQLTLRNEGGESLNWSATPAQSWISLSPTAGTLGAGSSQEVTLTINRDGQPAGTILGAVTFSWGSGGVVSVRVSAEVAPQPVLGIAPLLLDFGIDKTSLSLVISNTGNGILHWTIQTPSEGWITLSQREGNTTTQPATVDVRIDRDKAPNGQQEVRLVVTAQGAQQEVILKADIRRPAKLSLSNSQLDFGKSEGAHPLTLRNEGGEPLNWSATPDQPWISLSPTAGTLGAGSSQEVTFTINRDGQPAGTILGTVTFSWGSGGVVSVRVSAEVAPQPVLGVAPLLLDFGIDKNSLSLVISNTGNGILHWTIQTPSEGWITLSQREGNTTTQPATVDVRIDRDKAPNGQQEVRLVVTAQGAQQEVILKANIRRPAKLSLLNSQLDFGETALTQQLTLRNDGGESLNWSAKSGQSWIALDPASGTLAPGAQQTVTITVDRSGQPVGTLQGSVNFSSDGGPADASIRVDVPQRPALTVSPSELNFRASENLLPLELRNIGGGTLDWTLEVSDTWIRPTKTSGSLIVGDSPRLFIEVSREGLDVNPYVGLLTFRWGENSLEVRVLMQVEAKPDLGLSAGTIDLGTDSSATFSIANTGTGVLIWKAVETKEWLELDRYQGTASNLADPVEIRVNRKGLFAGPQEAAVVIQSDGGDTTLVVRMEVPLPEVQIISGPREDEEIDTDPIDFRFTGVNAYGKTEFSTRLNEGSWGNWSTANEVSFSNLEESSLTGLYVFQVRVRADAGQSEVPLERRFTVNTIKGPALRFSPKADTVSVGDEVKIELVAEEVGDILGAHAVLSFNPSLLKLQEPVEVLAEDSFLSGFGGTIVQPEPQIDNSLGRLDLALGIAEGRQLGTPRTGAIARLRFQALKSGMAELSFRPESALRDLNNENIAIGLHKIKIVVK